MTFKNPKNKHYFYMDEVLYKVQRKNRGQNLLLAMDKDRKDVVFNLSDVRKSGYKAYTTKDVSEMMNRHMRSIVRLVKQGFVPAAERWYDYETARIYYSKTAVMQVHKAISIRNMANARKGFVKIEDIPTGDELKSQLDHGFILYARSDDGEFVRVWEAEDW